jgi:hypothetical protein
MGRFSDWLEAIEEILDITLFNKWLWIIIACASIIVVFPFLIMIALMNSPSWLAGTATILIIVGWGIVGGYKEWSLHKRKEEKAGVSGQEAIPFNYEKYSFPEDKKKKEYD